MFNRMSLSIYIWVDVICLLPLVACYRIQVLQYFGDWFILIDKVCLYVYEGVMCFGCGVYGELGMWCIWGSWTRWNSNTARCGL